jgi:DNA processing protein
VAVLGTGADLAYPKEHTKLYEEIAEKGLVLSEYPLSTPPLPQNFPRRNRIISGLAHGVLVVEAPLRSGSLMTARLALDYNREVFAVPGHAAGPKSSGVNKLIKDGAALIESAADVMEALSLTYCPPEENAPEKSAPKLSSDERAVYKTLGTELLHIDDIAGLCGFPVIKVSSLLLGMELRGLVEQKPGKCFLRRF